MNNLLAIVALLILTVCSKGAQAQQSPTKAQTEAYIAKRQAELKRLEVQRNAFVCDQACKMRIEQTVADAEERRRIDAVLVAQRRAQQGGGGFLDVLEGIVLVKAASEGRIVYVTCQGSVCWR